MNGQIWHVLLGRGRREWPWGTCRPGLCLRVVVWWSRSGTYYHLPFVVTEHSLFQIQLLPISSTGPSPLRESLLDASWIHLVSSMNLGSFLIILRTWFTADMRQHLGSLTKWLLNGLWFFWQSHFAIGSLMTLGAKVAETSLKDRLNLTNSGYVP